MPFGAQIAEDGVRFALWAPTARDVVIQLNGARKKMVEAPGGWRHFLTPQAEVGTEYQFVVNGQIVPDPASRFQPRDVFGPSVVIDPRSYRWENPQWLGRPWEEAVIYEIHVGTATSEGNYAALQARLPDLATLGITAIQLMPLAEVPGGRNWGYDGVLPFAPESAYGTPDDLKRLVDCAHGLGMMVLLDVVYNHFGPSGNYLNNYANCFFTERHHTPWGAAINCDGPQSDKVRSFFIENALYWLDEFNFDGLRLDAVHAILDDSNVHFLEELARRVRADFPDRQIHLILENEANEARLLARDGARPSMYTAQWDDDIHNSWHVLLTGESEAYYGDFSDKPLEHLGRALAEGFAYQGEFAHHLGHARGEPSGTLPPQAFVSFLQNHDQIGNRAGGERLSHLVDDEKLSLARAIHLLSPHIPLLFMGEDWAASTPFLFFTGFDEDETLSDAIRKGRQNEFAKFAAFCEISVPDPTSLSTFERSKLKWEEATQEPHASIRTAVRDLLRLRRRYIVPLLRSRFHGGAWKEPATGMLDVRWDFEAGRLRIVMNFDDAADVDVEEMGTVIWSSAGVNAESNRVHLGSFHAVVFTYGSSR